MNKKVIPKKSLGNWKINSHINEILQSPSSYEASDHEWKWMVELPEEHLVFSVKKSDLIIASIWTDIPEYHYEDKAWFGMEFWQFMENFPDHCSWGDAFRSRSLNGIEFYFTDEPEDSEDEDVYLYTTLNGMCVFDPTVDWDEEAKKPHLPCPFPEDKIVYRWNEKKS